MRENNHVIHSLHGALLSLHERIIFLEWCSDWKNERYLIDLPYGPMHILLKTQDSYVTGWRSYFLDSMGNRRMIYAKRLYDQDSQLMWQNLTPTDCYHMLLSQWFPEVFVTQSKRLLTSTYIQVSEEEYALQQADIKLMRECWTEKNIEWIQKTNSTNPAETFQVDSLGLPMMICADNANEIILGMPGRAPRLTPAERKAQAEERKARNARHRELERIAKAQDEESRRVVAGKKVASATKKMSYVNAARGYDRSKQKAAKEAIELQNKEIDKRNADRLRQLKDRAHIYLMKDDEDYRSDYQNKEWYKKRIIELEQSIRNTQKYADFVYQLKPIAELYQKIRNQRELIEDYKKKGWEDFQDSIEEEKNRLQELYTHLESLVKLTYEDRQISENEFFDDFIDDIDAKNIRLPGHGTKILDAIDDINQMHNEYSDTTARFQRVSGRMEGFINAKVAEMRRRLGGVTTFVSKSAQPCVSVSSSTSLRIGANIAGGSSSGSSSSKGFGLSFSSERFVRTSIIAPASSGSFGSAYGTKA